MAAASEAPIQTEDETKGALSISQTRQHKVWQDVLSKEEVRELTRKLGLAE